jgi:hypothetical protein
MKDLAMKQDTEGMAMALDLFFVSRYPNVQTSHSRMDGPMHLSYTYTPIKLEVPEKWRRVRRNQSLT